MITAFNIILITMIGLIREPFVSDAVTFSIVPVALCSAILLFDTSYVLFSDRKNIKYDVVFSALFLLMLSCEDVLKTMRRMDAEPFNTVFKLVYFPVLIICLIIDIDYALYRACKEHPVKEGSVAANGKFLGIYYPVWVYIAVTFVFLTAYYPGVMHTDFEKEWMWGYDTNWNDWHTVGYLFFVKLCTMFTGKPFMITIAIALMYYLTANYTVGVMKKHFPSYPHMGWVYICLYICLGFYSCMYIGEVQKNNLSTPMMLAFSTSILDYILSREHKKREYVNMAVFAFMASIFRHSLWEIVLVTLICVIAYAAFDTGAAKSEKKRNIIGLSAVFVSAVLSFLILTEGIAFGILKAERNPAYVKYTIPMNLAASLAYRSRETGIVIDDDIVRMMEQIIPLEKWAQYYCPYDADTTCRQWHEIGDNVLKLNDPQIASDLIKVDWYYLTHYPKQFVLSFFDVNSIVWEIGKASDLIMYSPSLVTEHYEIHHMRKGEFFHFTENTKVFTGSSGIGRTIIYRGGIYLFLMFLIILILWRKHCSCISIAMLPILLYALALMISIPQEGSHYIMAFPLYVALFGTTAYYSGDHFWDKEPSAPNII